MALWVEAQRAKGKVRARKVSKELVMLNEGRMEALQDEKDKGDLDESRQGRDGDRSVSVSRGRSRAPQSRSRRDSRRG